MRMSYLYASDFPFKNFCKIAQHTEAIRNVWEKNNDAYSLSIRVQIAINHISIVTFLCFLRQYQRQRKCFLSERELKKGLRDTLTRAAWLGPSNFLLVRLPCKLFWTLLSPARVQPLYGAGTKESSGTGLASSKFT